METNCPVCKKSGLADYTKTHTVCPQCDSDLKPFLLLHNLKKAPPPRVNLFALAGIFIVACAFAILYFNSYSSNKQLLSENLKVVQQYQDSIKLLHSALAQVPKLNQENKLSQSETVIQYKVKKGDCPSVIAQFFYNDWRRYKTIEADNDLKQPYSLKVGRILRIKLTQK